MYNDSHYLNAISFHRNLCFYHGKSLVVAQLRLVVGLELVVALELAVGVPGVEEEMVSGA